MLNPHELQVPRSGSIELAPGNRRGVGVQRIRAITVLSWASRQEGEDEDRKAQRDADQAQYAQDDCHTATGQTSLQILGIVHDSGSEDHISKRSVEQEPVDKGDAYPPTRPSNIVNTTDRDHQHWYDSGQGCQPEPHRDNRKENGSGAGMIVGPEIDTQ